MASWRMKTKKDGTEFYEIKVSRGRSKPCVYTTWDVPKGWSQKSIERELQRVASEFEQKVKTGEVTTLHERKEAEERAMAEAKKIKTVRQYIDGVFLPAKEITLSQNGIYSYKQFCDHYIIPAIGDMLIVDVTSAIITKTLLEFQKTHAYSSCIKLYNIINGIFKMATKDDTILINPMQKVDRPAARKDEKKHDESDKAYTVDELRHAINCSWQEYQDAIKKIENEKAKDDTNPDTVAYWEKMCLIAFRWYVYLNLSIDTGARRGELCGLQWQDINWTTPGIVIHRNVQYDPSKGIYVTTPKNGKTRSVDIGEETLTLLKHLRTKQAETRLTKWVFPTEIKREKEIPECMSPQSATQYFKRFGDRHGLKNFHPHILRHSSASIAITNGADVTSVSARLGHSDTAVTLRMYAHANEESIRRAGQTVRDALNAPQVKQA